MNCQTMNSRKRLLYVGIAVVGLYLTALAGPAGAGRCPGRGSVRERDFTVECSTKAADVSVEVICHSDDWAAFPDFKVNLASVKETRFTNCSFAQNSSLLDIFHAMNVKSSSEFLFENLRLAPSRQNFPNLSVPQLTFDHSNLTELPFDMLYDVLGLEKLIILETNLHRIPNNFFENWSRNLRNLDILNGKLQKIAKDDLAHLGNLQQLILWGNEISEIEEGAFDNQSSLKVLELSNNRLRTLPPGIFRNLARLEIINLRRNPFDELPSDLFTSIKDFRLEKFFMSYIHGSLKTLPDQFFRNLIFLEEVELTSNQLESLPEHLFDGSSALKHLDLSNNTLKSLPLGFFSSLVKLEKLDLSKNQIVNLPPGIFANSIGLKVLNISHNSLTTLESNVLQGLGSLTILNASHNNIMKVDTPWCKNLSSLASIDLSFNQLSLDLDRLSIFVQCDGSLKYIYFSNNKATEILDDLSNREIIDLSYNELTKLTTEDITQFNHIGGIDLRNNKISNIDFTNFATTVAIYKTANGNQFPGKPAKFILGDNPLHCDCHLIDFVRVWNSKRDDELRQYVKLTASNHTNDRGYLKCASPPEFENYDLHKIHPENLYCILKTFKVDDACTNNCTCREYPAKQVLSVDCSYRNLTQLPDMISNAHNWSIELNMAHNMLKQTTSLTIAYLANVTRLDLSHNFISTVTIDVFTKNLVDLKLDNNRISRLDDAVVKYLADNGTLQKLTLHENPWECDCKALRFHSFVQSKTSTYNFNGVLCSGTNIKLSGMTTSDVCKDAIAIIVVVSLLVAFFGILIGILAALYYKHQKEVKVWLYSKQWCLWFVTEDELDKDKKYDAFVSFSHKDEDFVENEIVAKLEDGPRPYKLCLHYRDWLAGEWIPVQISQSVEDSRRTIVVLSPNFLESVWAKLEFRAAHTQALKEGRARLIVILYGDIENTDILDPELKSYLSLHTYIKWGDPWFWDKLRYALPHRYEPSRHRTRNAQIIEDHLVRQPMHNGNANGKSNEISMSKLVNDSARLLDSGVDERTVATC